MAAENYVGQLIVHFLALILNTLHHSASLLMALQVLGRCVIQLAFRQCHLGGLLKARECRLAGKRHE